MRFPTAALFAALAGLGSFIGYQAREAAQTWTAPATAQEIPLCLPVEDAYPEPVLDRVVDNTADLVAPPALEVPEPAPLPAATAINWIDAKDCKSTWPTWVHYWGDNCGPCEQEAHYFLDPEVIRQSTHWNCISQKVTSGKIPQDAFKPPADAPADQQAVFHHVGAPDSTTALATLLYETWPKVMPKPEQSVVQSRKRILGGLLK